MLELPCLAEGEANAISAEVAALAKILERDTMEGGQVIDRHQVEHGFEKALVQHS